METGDTISALTVSASIIIYTLFEYHRREQLHRETMGYLKRDMLPPDTSTRPELWTLVTTGCMCCVLFLVSAGMVYLAITRGGASLLMPFLTLAFVFGVLFAFVLTLLLRDIRRYRTTIDIQTGGVQ